MEFLETFEGIKLNKEQAGYLDDVNVTKITRNRTRGIVRVYIESSHIIPKTVVFDTEKALKTSIFQRKITPSGLKKSTAFPISTTWSISMKSTKSISWKISGTLISLSTS